MNAISDKYTRTAVVLHWLIALMIITNLVLVWTVDSLPEEWQRYFIDTHKSIGITVLGLVLLRVLWRVGHRPPPLPADTPTWEQKAASTGHVIFYVLILCLPLSGWMHDSAWKDAATHPMSLYGLIPWPRIGWIMGADPATKETMHTTFGDVHSYLGYVLYVLLSVHILAALKHQFWDRHAEFRRMWF